MKASAPRAARKITAAVVSAALVFSAITPAVPALAAGNVRVGGPVGKVGRAGGAGAAGTAGVGTSFTVPTLAPLALTPAFTPANTWDGPKALPGDRAYAAAAPADAPLARPAPIVAPAAPAAPSRVLTAAGPAASVAAPADAPVTLLGRFLESLSGAADKRPSESTATGSAADAKLRGDALFTGAKAKPALAEPVAGARSQPKALARWTRRAAVGALAMGSSAALALGQSDGGRAAAQPAAPAAAPAAAAPVAADPGLLGVLGQGGYLIGNALAFVFPLPEIYRAFKTGSAKAMPAWRAGILIAANLALGLISAPVAGMAFWGIQNLFGAAAMLAVWPAAWAGKRLGADPAGPGFSGKAAVATGVGSLLVLGLSAAAYFAAEAAVPGLLSGLLGPEGIGRLTLGIQIVTGGMYLLLFAPDLLAMRRGQVPQGFTPGFSLAFMVSSVGFLIWTIKMALGAPFGSSEMIQFSVYAALNALYAVTAGISWNLARKSAPRGPPPAGPASTLPAPNDAPAPNNGPVEEYGPIHDEFPGLPRRLFDAPEAAEPMLPRSWGRLPSEAREASPEALVAAKAEAQERARRVVPDARLVSVAIDLEDPRSHWIFVFRSDESRREITVWTKRVGVRRLGFRAAKAPTLWDTRLESVGGLDKAYAALKAAAPRFRPARVEADPAWNGPAAWRFTDRRGVAVSVGADGKVVSPASPLANVAGAAAPKSFVSLPEDARGADGRSLLALKAEAQERARRLEPDARLVRVAINLDDARAHWIFVFRSDKSRRELTVWAKRVKTKRLTPRQSRVKVPTLWDTRLEAASSVREAYAALKAAKPSLKPIRLELLPSWKGDATWHFLDGRGRASAPVAAVARPAQAPAPQVPGDRAPPEAPSLPVPGKPQLPAPVPQPKLPVPAPQLPAPPAEPPQVPPGDEPPEPPKSEPPQTKPAPGPRGPIKWLHEDFLGFRKAQGVRRDPKLGRLSADADAAAVIDHISRQFGISRDRLVASAARQGIHEDGPVDKWLAVYDKLQAANRAQFERYDHKKYSGWKSFRELANKTYPAGWRGALLRVSELHKHLVGAAVRLPYHLFDMFFFGYFRRAITFEFFRTGQDFLSIEDPDLAERWFDAVIRDVGLKGRGALGGLRSKAWYRQLEHWFIVPLVKPMTTFVARRITLAIFSAVAMGLLGALSPVLPLSFAISSIPLLGPVIVGLLNGLPVAVAAVPFVGPVLAPVFAAATGALVKDLVLGPLLNTLILASLLTFPRAMRERLAPIKDRDPGMPVHWFNREVVLAVLGTFVSWTFWRANLKSFVSLATVGAEIEVIMTYAGQIDSAVDPVIESVTGVKPGIMHAIGAAIERPDVWTDEEGVEHHNLIPFGGAITWGNVLLYKLQTFVGFDIADHTMRAALMVKALTGHEGATDAALMRSPAAGVVHEASTREGRVLPFEPDLWRQPMDAAMARIRELAGTAGGLDAELVAVREHLRGLRAALGDHEARLAALRAQSRPLTPEERAEYDRLLRELDGQAAEDYVRSKLAERRDLQNPAPDELAELRRLRALQERYAGVMVPPPDEPAGAGDDLAVREASLRAMASRLTDYAEGRVERGPLPPVDPATLARIETLLGEIEGLRNDVRGEMTQRDATQRLLQAQARVRQLALRDRRDGSEMRGFHENMARLATVMDLALSLNEIAAAQSAIRQMLDLLEAKRARIAGSRAGNQADQAAADANRARVAEWRSQIDRDILSDDRTIRDMQEAEIKAGMTAQRVTRFQTDMAAFLAALDAEDGGASGSAATEYQRRLSLLPQVREWRLNGNPNDPDAFSVREFQEQLAEVESNIARAEEGLAQIPTAPVEFAGVLIPLIPGPEVRVTNPSREQVLQILADRRVHWQDRMADFQSSLDSVTRLLDPGNTRTATDEFGDTHPESLPRWRAQEAARLDAARTALAEKTARMDAYAAQINRAAGSNIPMLSGLSIEQMQDAIAAYGDALRAVNFPDGDTLELHEAQMNLIALASLTPPAARDVIRASRSEATIEAIDEATTSILPVTQQRLQGVLQMMRDILADVDADEALIRSGGFGGQELIDRKTALLRDRILPPLRGAQSMLRDTLIPYQQRSAEGAASGTSDLWRLFDSQLTLVTEARRLNDRTIPWALAAFGAPEGDTGAAMAAIAEWRQRLQRNIDGYDDAEGHHKGIREYQVELANRRDPNFMGTEELYGETQPYSLPRKIAQYTAERTQRVGQYNASAAEVNAILERLRTVSGGRHDLSGSLLPVGVTDDAAGVARIQAVVDAEGIPNLADRLRAIADEAQAAEAGSAISIGGTGGDGTVPTGTQPPITISANQQIALLALDAARRLAPSSLQTQDQSSVSFAMARILYSDAVVDGATEAFEEQLPTAEAFLARATQVLDRTIADTARDEAYVQSGGTSETAAAVLERKARVFTELDAFLVDTLAFFNVKQGWNRDGYATVDRIGDYYDSLSEIYSGGQTANDNEVVALDTMRDALLTTFNDLEQTRREVTGWLAQLNDPRQSALRRVSESISEIQDRTRRVLEENVRWHDLSDEVTRSQDAIRASLTLIDGRQAELARILEDPALQGALPASVVRRIEDLRMNRTGYMMGDPRTQAQALVVRKSDFTSFVDTLLGMFTSGAQGLASRDIAALRADLLRDPRALASIIPDSAVMEFGDVDGFYLVYQSRFSVPNGLETSSWVTLGNVARVWGNNVSVTGYQFASPPNEGNAPYGDKGVAVQVESLQGRNWVNYLNVDLHRFALDIPADSQVRTGVSESRLMVFNDFAVMLMGDRLYLGLAGFGDASITDPDANPYYYGGNVKASLRLTEVMRLNVEQQELFARDPRTFLQEVNLDFTGFDPDLDRTWLIEAAGENKRYSRTQVGPSVDVNRLFNLDGAAGDTFTVDLFYSRVAGTDDINQQAVGASVINGISLRNDQGREWARIDNRLTGEVGESFNTLTDRISLRLPERGITVSAEGRIAGQAHSYYAEVSKEMSSHSRISVGYGAPAIGLNNRLNISMSSSFTLGELWSAVLGNSAENLRGGETLQTFNRQLDEFFRGDGRRSRAAGELERVFAQDVARRLITQDIGVLTREIQDLRRAGAFMDNSRVRGMVGFVSSPVSDDLAERAVGGGFSVGSYTEMSLSRTQRALLESKTETLYREGLRLQDRLLQLTRDWQGSVVELAQAQWALKMATFEVQNAGNAALRREAEARVAAAEDRLHQALLAYNAISGRDPSAPMPFNDLTVDDLNALLESIRATIASPDRLREILGALEPGELAAAVGPDPFNALDWLPWVDRLAVGFGVQFQDMMANQALTVGTSLRIPVYDPRSEAADNAYLLESEATREEMRRVFAERSMTAAGEAEQARLWQASARTVAPGAPAAASALSDAIRGYRNGIIGPDDLRRAFADWSWYANTSLETLSRAALADARAAVDAPYLPAARPDDASALRLGSLDDAFAVASRNSSSLAEIALRQAAAEEMTRANDNRIQRVFVDLNVGTGLTASGVGWIPSIGITGVPINPVLGFELKPEELRELQVRQGQQQSEYYDALKARLEAALAVQFYQNAVALRSAEARVRLYDGQVIPELEARLAAASGTGAVTAARRELDQARLGREEALRAHAQARTTLNFLLGRPTDAPLALDFDESQALAALTQILAAKDPAGAQRRINAARVEIARAVETMADKDLRVEQLSVEPVGLVVRSFGRLLDAIGGDAIGNPDLVAAARVQTLVEERAAEAYDAQRSAQASRLRVELDAATLRLAALAGREDPGSRLERNRLQASAFALRAQLLALGEVPTAPRREALPSSWADLTRSLSEASQAAAAVAPGASVDLLGPETLRHRSAAFVRYYVANQTLGHEPIDRNFVEGWIEVRLRDMNTPPEVLIALARLREEKAERLYRHALVGAAARADILSAQFESDARLLRWLRAQGAGSTDPRVADLTVRLQASRVSIVSLLGLDPATPLEDLVRLVPEDATPAADLRDLSGRLIADIRESQLDSIRRTLFDGGLPAALGNEDGLMGQIRADTIAERMSYKGFTPVAAFGVFRGRAIGSGFIEAPDPREIERGLENVMTDVLRRELQSTGRLQELSLRLHSLMARVEDGSRRLEAQRRLIEAAEADLRARTALATDPAGHAEMEAARARLVDAWMEFSRQMVETKSVFITLVTELEALGVTGPSLRPFTPPQAPERAHNPRPDTRDQLLDFWAEQYADPAFAAQSDAFIARLGPAVTAETLGRLERAARAYRTASADADAVELAAFSPAERADLMMRADREGRRLAVRAALAEVLTAVGRVERGTNPAAAELLTLLRGRAESAAEAFRLDREAKQGVIGELRREFWRSEDLDPAVAGAFERLETRSRALDAARRALMTEYLTEAGDDPRRFILRDATLDASLRAQKAFDDELVLTLEDPAVAASPAAVRGLDALYGVSRVLARAADRAKYGRGMDALDALISLEESRVRAARFNNRPPAFIDAAAEALQTLRETRARWLDGRVELQPVYAVTQLDASGRRTWSVDQWLTPDEFERLRAAGEATPGAEGVIVGREGRWFVDRVAGRPDARYEVIGGVDVEQARRDGAAAALQDNATARSLAERMTDSDFVAPGAAGEPAAGWSFAEVFGPAGLHRDGRVFFFEAQRAGPTGTRRALHPLEALARPPEQVVMMVYGGEAGLRRDRFPTLESLQGSELASEFRVLTVSPSGAAELVANARRFEASELRRGWIEVKLNSWGFARDEAGRVTQLYRTRDDFEAQRTAFERAAADLAAARAALAAARAEVDRLAAAETAARAEYDAGRAEARGFIAASEATRRARAAVVNAETDAREAEEVARRAGAWTLYRTDSLRLGLDAAGAVVRVSAAPDRGAAALDETLPGGGPQASVVETLAAAVIDEDGRLRRGYATDGQVDEASERWTLMSLAPGGDRSAYDEEGRARMRVRYSHYVESVDGAELPVTLGQRYLIDKMESTGSRLWRTRNWALMPWNWGSLALELPRGVVGAPVEVLTGRDPRQHHYLGRAYMYKTEGGTTERYGLFRTVAGVIDVFNFLPDPVGRAYDPSQFPETVQAGVALRPGESLFDRRLRTVDGERTVHLGTLSLQRMARHAAEDLEAARGRTLARFSGGVEQTIIETRRGRAGAYQESFVSAEPGAAAVARRLADPLVAADPRSSRREEVVTSATPGHLLVDRVERRVRITPGAEGYDRQADALDGYGDRAAARAGEAAAAREGLERAVAEAERRLGTARDERDAASVAARDALRRWHELAWRIGRQLELERRIAALEAEIAGLRERIRWWERYADLLEEARRVPPGPVNPDPRNPWNPNPFFWVWAFLAAVFAALAAALWHHLRERRAPRPA
ncbi:MAG: hypothetical protein SF051_12200 [Elusimicrobiota bacterium]|nr:hypothetical protein [Elusimicrobiota bacterium]